MKTKTPEFEQALGSLMKAALGNLAINCSELASSSVPLTDGKNRELLGATIELMVLVVGYFGLE